jgi:hypothetical protein
MNLNKFNKKPIINEDEEEKKIEHPDRLQFDEHKNLIANNDLNTRILNIVPELVIDRNVVLDKLEGYRLVRDNNTSTRNWTRYISVLDKKLRAGGFPIKNDPQDEFIVFKNVSKNFTFSVKRVDVILIEKIPKKDLDELLTKPLKDLFNKYEQQGKNFLAIKNTFDEDIVEANNINKLSKAIGISRNAITNTFKAGKKISKEYYLFKFSTQDKELFINEYNEIPQEDRTLIKIPKDLMEIINKYYPEK